MALTEEQISQLKQEHGDELLLLEKPQDLVFKKAAPVVWADFQESVAKEKGTHDGAFRRLCYNCIVFPERKALEDVFRTYPALATKIATKIAEISGQGDDFEVKKL